MPLAETPPPRNPMVRLARSLRRHGPGHTLRQGLRHVSSFFSRRRDRDFDARYGTDTGAFVEVDDLPDVAGPNRSHAIRYEPTRAAPLRAILRAAAPPLDGTFVDIGCGKGRTMILALEHGFRKVAGVEFSRPLCDIAKRNIDTCLKRNNIDATVDITHGDAVEYEFAPDHNVIFMYNPFDAHVMEPLMGHLRASISQHPRRVVLIYHNPVCHETVVSRGGFRLVMSREFGACPFAVYESTGDVPPRPR